MSFPASTLNLRISVVILFVALFAGLFAGCGTSYQPKPLTAEQKELKQQYSGFSGALRRTMEESGDYIQVAVVDRSTTFPDNEQQYTRVLVLHREQLDLDDYGFSPPGKESSESGSDYIEGFFSDVMFWTDNEGNITFDDYDQPPGTQLVVEWCVPTDAGDKVSLHFGGNPCVILDLTAQ